MSRVARLKQIGRQLTATSSVGAVWRTAVEAAVSLLGADAGAWVWSTPMPDVVVGANGEAFDLAFWQALLGYADEVAREPQIVVFPDTVDSLSGALYVPVEVGSWCGWLVLGVDSDSLSSPDLELAVAVSEMARLVVMGLLPDHDAGASRQKAASADGAMSSLKPTSTDTQHNLDQGGHLRAFAALHRVTDEISTTVELDRILRVVIDEVVGFTQADAGLLVMLNDTVPEIKVWKGYEVDEIAAITDDLAARSDESDLWPGITRQALLNLPDVVGLAGCPRMRSLVVAPVVYEQRLAAAILIQSATPAFFSEIAIDFCQALAGQMALAIGNARRYQEQLRRGELMRQRAEQMSLLLEISRTMRSDRSLEEILADVVYAVQEGTGFEIVLISVLEGNLLRRVAAAGIPVAEFEERKGVRLRWDRVRRLCQEPFRLGQCYYIPERHRHLSQGLDVFISQDPVSRDGPNGWHTEDIYFVPLRTSAGDTIGILSVDRPRNGLAPTAITSEVLELFAAQVAQMIEMHNLVHDLRRQVTTLQLFNELNRSITTKLDLPMVLNTVVQSVTNLLGYDFSTVFLKDRDQEAFVALASSGYALELLDEEPLVGDRGLIDDVVLTGMPLVIEDALNDARFRGIRLPIGSTIIVPMMADGRSVGILTADRKRTGEFSPADVAAMVSLADQVTVAIENASLFEEVTRFSAELEARVSERTQELASALDSLRAQRDRSEVLYHIASELVASLDMDRVLTRALQLLQRAVKASRSSVILLDDDTGYLVYRAAIGHAKPIPPGGKPAPFSREEGIVGWVLEQRQPIVIPDVQVQTVFDAGAMPGIHSVMAVPVLGGTGESRGVLLFESPVIDVFDETQRQLVEAAAVQLGNALNNAELYGMIREQAQRLGTMLRAQQIDVAKNRAILEGVADGVMFADASGKIVLFNAAAERILSITREQALDRPQQEILGLYAQDVHEWLSQIDPRHQDGDAGDKLGFSAHRLVVGRRYVSVHLSPVMTETGEFLGVASVFRDITAEIEADRAKSDFVSTVSHELRTPMTSIVGYVDLMLHGAVGEVSDSQRGFLTKVKANADRLTNLVNDLLDISRLEQGRLELLRRPMEMGAVVMQVADLVKPEIAGRRQTIEAIVPEELPRVDGDPDKLAQILTNLVSNAHKYTPIGGQIKIYTYVRDGMMHVAVADNGIGIAPENQKRIFERFYRVEDDPAVYEVSGTGLGLAISLSLIQMHGGSIWLESELGVGSIFTFSVPLAAGELQQDVGDLPRSTVKPAAPLVLVVDDDAEISQLLRITLEAEGMRVLTASSGEEALRLARQELPDFISLDIRLPDLDGLEVLQLLKRDAETADIPVVMVSVVSDRERGLALGALDYLTKPLDTSQLMAIVNKALSQREIVVVSHSDKSFLNRMRSALQLEGLGVRTTMRGERAIRLARDLQPRLIVMDAGLPDVDCRQMLGRLRRDERTSEIPLIVISAPGYLDKRDCVTAQDFCPIRIVSEPVSAEEVAAEVIALVDQQGVECTISDAEGVRA